MSALNAGPSAREKPARTLPDRSGRNVHPAGLPKSRRNKEQVEADRKVALKASEEEAYKSQMAKDDLAQMNALEEREEEDLPALYPQRLSARIDKRRLADIIESETDECFDIRVDSDEDSDLDSPSQSDKATKAKTKVSVSCPFNRVGIYDLNHLSAYKAHQGGGSSGAFVKDKGIA